LERSRARKPFWREISAFKSPIRRTHIVDDIARDRGLGGDLARQRVERADQRDAVELGLGIVPQFESADL